ncbi:MAG: hypothetical protein AB1589_11650 [Cyanobacteriota bacterium]
MPNQDYSVLDWTKKAGASLGVVALSLTALLLPGCSGGEEIEEGRTNTTAGEVAQVSPDPTIGKEVTIRSDAAKAVGKSGFLMTPENGESVLVINATGTPFVLPAGDMPVQATGRVADFVVADVEKEFNLALEDELYTDYARKPAIIAKSLALAPTPEDLYKAPAGYFDKEIAIEGEVRKLEGAPNTFALFEDGWVDDIGILVVGANRDVKLLGSEVDEGEKVVVTGVTRNVNILRQQAQTLGWDENDIAEFEKRYTNRPIIVATEVYPSAVDNK